MRRFHIAVKFDMIPIARLPPEYEQWLWFAKRHLSPVLEGNNR